MQLQQLSIQGPGSQGLNSEISPFQQSIEFALKADNAVIDRVGRLAAREAFADFVWDNNFRLKPEETYDIVRMETVMYDQDRPVNPDVFEISKFNDTAFDPEGDTTGVKVGAEYNMAEYNGLLLSENADPRPDARRFVEQAYGSQYGIGQYGRGDEYNGGFTTSFDDHMVIGIAGVYVKEQRYNAEYNRPQSQYGVMEYAQKRDFTAQNYDYYIVFELRGPKLYRLGQWTPKNGLNNCQLVPFMDSIFLFSAGEPPIAFYKGSSALISDHPDYKPPRDGDRGSDEDGNPYGLNIIAPELMAMLLVPPMVAFGLVALTAIMMSFITLICLCLISGMTALLIPSRVYRREKTPLTQAASLTLENTGPRATTRFRGIAAHNGFLVIFGRHSILIYSGAQGDPAGENGLQLQDAIRDVGLLTKMLCATGYSVD